MRTMFKKRQLMKRLLHVISGWRFKYINNVMVRELMPYMI